MSLDAEQFLSTLLDELESTPASTRLLASSIGCME
jgi:hypothetical protein